MSWSHVQGTGGAGPGTSIAVSPGSNLTVGDLAVVSISAYNSATIGISDTNGNTWTLAESESPYGYVWYSKITVGGSSTITVTSSDSNYLAISYDEYSVAGTIALDNGNGAVSFISGSTVSTGSVTTSGTDLFYTSFTGSSSGGTFTATGVSNSRYAVASASGWNQALYVYDSLNVTGTQSATGTYSITNQILSAIGVTFKAPTKNSSAAILLVM